VAVTWARTPFWPTSLTHRAAQILHSGRADMWAHRAATHPAALAVQLTDGWGYRLAAIPFPLSDRRAQRNQRLHPDRPNIASAVTLCLVGPGWQTRRSSP
jgi:hypothetical protein